MHFLWDKRTRLYTKVLPRSIAAEKWAWRQEHKRSAQLCCETDWCGTMKIIGHRGAAGLALENTLPSLELARLLGVDAIEFDVRKTKDEELVLCHDADLERISGQAVKIIDSSLEDLQQIRLSDGESAVPTLREALKVTGKRPVVIELKQRGCAMALMRVLEDFPDRDITIASFKLNELTDLRNRSASLKLVGLERTKPFDIIQFARQRKLDGVGLNFWLLNPLTYLLIKRSNLSLYVFTVNNKLVGRMIAAIYPKVAVCTDHPEWFIKHPWLRLRQSNRTRKLKLKR